MDSAKIICITGIDTDIGKSIVTGALARFLSQSGKTVITQKICQTGCEKVSEDIVTHRRIMGIDMQEVDESGLTCPYIFPEPCSPHLAARLAASRIDCDRITSATAALAEQYQYVLVEGVGGLLVPLVGTFTLLDYLEQQGYPQILVSHSRLGSINHTLSALEILKGRGVDLLGLVYNRFRETNALIAEDSAAVFRGGLKQYGFASKLIDMPEYLDNVSWAGPDFSELFSEEF